MFRNLATATLLLSLFSSLPAGIARASEWAEASNPYRIDSRFETRLDRLETEAVLAPKRLPWSGPYWSDRRGSIGYSWQTRQTENFQRLGPTELRLLPSATIAKMSPAEKIDIARGRYDYPTIAHVQALTSGRNRLWEGLCAGWSQTSLLYEEPSPVTLTNPDGIAVPFGSADIKALIAYYYDHVAVRMNKAAEPVDERRVVQLGHVCDSDDPRAHCRRDLNAGALHIVLANRIARQGRGLLADFSRGKQIWQHPVYGYEAKFLGSRVPHPGAAPNAVREVQVRLDLLYADYDQAQWSPRPLRDRERTLRYWLEIDHYGKIVGGKFLSIGGGRALDYLWTSERIPFRHGFEILGDLVSPR